jgi:hypothetical protein
VACRAQQLFDAALDCGCEDRFADQLEERLAAVGVPMRTSPFQFVSQPAPAVRPGLVPAGYYRQPGRRSDHRCRRFPTTSAIVLNGFVPFVASSRHLRRPH